MHMRASGACRTAPLIIPVLGIMYIRFRVHIHFALRLLRDRVGHFYVLSPLSPTYDPLPSVHQNQAYTSFRLGHHVSAEAVSETPKAKKGSAGMSLRNQLGEPSQISRKVGTAALQECLGFIRR